MCERSHIVLMGLLAILTLDQILSLSISHASVSKNFGNGRRIMGSLKGKIFGDKGACDARRSSLSIPFVQIQRKSNNGFICNGLLISSHLVLTTPSCVDDMTNTSKFSVAYRQTNGSIARHDISWTCKHPAWRSKIGPKRKIALITLDKPLEASQLSCFAGTKLDQWRGSTSLAISRVDSSPSQNRSLLTDYLEAELVKCDEAAVRVDDPTSICLSARAQGKRLCNPQGSMLLWRQTDHLDNHLYKLGMLASASNLDADNCLAQQANKTSIEMLDLTRLWLDGHLSVLVHHCSKSR